MSTSNPSIITQTSAGASNWVRIPAISTEGAFYTVTGVLTSGDTIIVDVSNDPVLDANNVLDVSRLVSTGTATMYSSSESFSTSPFSKAFVGSWKWWRIRKTGTAGSATVSVR